MIRRMFWLTVGAVGGIMGYRRAVSLGRQVRGRGVTREALRASREVRSFSRDVREGMELYSARRPRAIGPTLRATALQREGTLHSPAPAGEPPPDPRARTAQTNNDVNEKDDR